MKRGVLVAAIGLACAVGIQATEPDAATRRWWAHVQALANDNMRGRDTGSPEHRQAQEYVARHLEQNGLKPAGEQGFFQPVPVHAYRLSAERSSAGLVRA